MQSPQARGVGRIGSALHVKAAADRVLAILGLLVLSPLLVIMALAIRVNSPGPIFYREPRAGRGGMVFRIYKFRTMVEGAEHIGLGRNVARNDERITRTGRWLRRTSLDELPQLLNVALGQMSVVGPRPGPEGHALSYTDRQRRRLEMRPGITGWAQVNGRNSLSWEDRIELDIWYIDHWSPSLDLRILLRTPRALLHGDDLYGPDGITTDLPVSRDASEVAHANVGDPAAQGAFLAPPARSGDSGATRDRPPPRPRPAAPREHLR
jgi:lipopolysaccharide/colanic/teichoic acid biosynthesis glycosyltransferase